MLFNVDEYVLSSSCDKGIYLDFSFGLGENEEKFLFSDGVG